ncbi:phospholipid carrier-dependent glycosyltransferase [Candidatus Woesearchaeota archaeon]|nr:phospholipid carrier-dependent glycosyltransferase [Candidatus Woesearchaeota archaeon]
MKQHDRKNKAYENIFLALLILFSFVIRLFPVDTSYFFWDETVYLQNAQYYAGMPASYTELNIRPPLLPMMLSGIYSLGLDAEVWSRVLMAFLNSLMVLLAFQFAKQHSSKAAWISAVIVSLLPFHILASKWVMTDALAALISGASVYFFFRGIAQVPKAKKSNFSMQNIYMGISGLIFGLSILVKFTSIIYAGVLFLALIYLIPIPSWPAKLSSLSAPLLLFAVFAILPMVPYLAWSHATFGNLYRPFHDAFHVVAENEPTSLAFSLWSLADFFGLFIVIFIIFAFYNFHGRKSYSGNFSSFMMYWALFMLLYYFVILQRGVAKPISMEWEAERFLLPALLPVILSCSLFLSNIKSQVIFPIVVIILMLQAQGYSRAYTPSIGFENGLRQVTKDASGFLRLNIADGSIVYCNLNCPVIAYYSKMEVRQIHDFPNLGPAEHVLILHDLREPRVYARQGSRYFIANGQWEANYYNYKE